VSTLLDVDIGPSWEQLINLDCKKKKKERKERDQIYCSREEKLPLN
jgi:hypothetical protein